MAARAQEAARGEIPRFVRVACMGVSLGGAAAQGVAEWRYRRYG